MELKKIKDNMTELRLNNGTYVLFSYETPVACSRYAHGLEKTEKHWSSTTTKHINYWIRNRGYNPKDIPTREQNYFNALIKKVQS